MGTTTSKGLRRESDAGENSACMREGGREGGRREGGREGGREEEGVEGRYTEMEIERQEGKEEGWQEAIGKSSQIE